MQSPDIREKDNETVKQRYNDFSDGAVWKVIMAQAVPLMLAQLVQLLYNVVDRIYIGHMNGGDSMVLTGVGITFPIITFITAFAALFGMGGVPLFSMSNGSGDTPRAERILGNSTFLLLTSACVLTVTGYVLMRPLLYLLGASDNSYIYAASYMKVYMAGTLFSMISTGLNGYISAQGAPKTGMLTTVIGALLNVVLDPIFIFALGLGVTGAAAATVISQMVSAVWVVHFLVNKAPQRIRKENVRPDAGITKRICSLGASNFVMSGTTCFVQIVCNTTLRTFGGDLYIGIMTILNSVRDMVMLPIHGLISGSQPVMGFNYGAKKYDRVKSAINFDTAAGAVYTVVMWLIIVTFPKFWFSVFTDDPNVTLYGTEALKIYFFGFVFMSFQFAGQSTFQALGDAKHAIFFSLLRKAVIVIPLTLILPRIGLGVNGVFIAEPISNAVGGLACFLTMRNTIYKKLTADETTAA